MALWYSLRLGGARRAALVGHCRRSFRLQTPGGRCIAQRFRASSALQTCQARATSPTALSGPTSSGNSVAQIPRAGRPNIFGSKFDGPDIVGEFVPANILGTQHDSEGKRRGVRRRRPSSSLDASLLSGSGSFGGVKSWRMCAFLPLRPWVWHMSSRLCRAPMAFPSRPLSTMLQHILMLQGRRFCQRHAARCVFLCDVPPPSRREVSARPGPGYCGDEPFLHVGSDLNMNNTHTHAGDGPSPGYLSGRCSAPLRSRRGRDDGCGAYPSASGCERNAWRKDDGHDRRVACQVHLSVVASPLLRLPPYRMLHPPSRSPSSLERAPPLHRRSVPSACPLVSPMPLSILELFWLSRHPFAVTSRMRPDSVSVCMHIDLYTE